MGPFGGLGAVILCDGTVEYVAMKFGILFGSCGTAVGARGDAIRPGVENDMGDDVRRGDSRLGDDVRRGDRRLGDTIPVTIPPGKGGLIGDRGTGFDGMKSLPSLPLADLTGTRLLVDRERFRWGIVPEGAVLGRNEGDFNFGNRTTARETICACREPENTETLVDEVLLDAAVFGRGLSGCRRGFIVKWPEDSSLVPVLSTEWFEDHGACLTGPRVSTGMG